MRTVVFLALLVRQRPQLGGTATKCGLPPGRTVTLVDGMNATSVAGTTVMTEGTTTATTTATAAATETTPSTSVIVTSTFLSELLERHGLIWIIVWFFQ